jgi:hypothetical protein
LNNQGWVSVGIDHDTAKFATASIRRWWTRMGQHRAKPPIGTYHCHRLILDCFSEGQLLQQWRPSKILSPTIKSSCGVPDKQTADQEFVQCHDPVDETDLPLINSWRGTHKRLASRGWSVCARTIRFLAGKSSRHDVRLGSRREF